MRNSLKNKNKYTLCAKSATLIFFMPLPSSIIMQTTKKKKKKKKKFDIALDRSYCASRIILRSYDLF